MNRITKLNPALCPLAIAHIKNLLATGTNKVRGCDHVVIFRGGAYEVDGESVWHVAPLASGETFENQWTDIRFGLREEFSYGGLELPPQPQVTSYDCGGAPATVEEAAPVPPFTYSENYPTPAHLLADLRAALAEDEADPNSTPGWHTREGHLSAIREQIAIAEAQHAAFRYAGTIFEALAPKV